MTIEIALEYIIPQRMEELGIGKNYVPRIEHLALQPLETKIISAYNQFYFLGEDADDVSVSSETGVFDLSFQNANKMQYEHQGEIIVKNYSSTINHLRFIQVIPKK
ncbi:MAG: hypothetical protein HY841_03965 [Bacteroidetes bacterium]|nr:hypothetical protein [Bacteroidota bacterium]